MTAPTATIQMVADRTNNDHARVNWFDRLGLKKAELVAYCQKHGLDHRGTRSALCYRIARSLPINGNN